VVLIKTIDGDEYRNRCGEYVITTWKNGKIGGNSEIPKNFNFGVKKLSKTKLVILGTHRGYPKMFSKYHLEDKVVSKNSPKKGLHKRKSIFVCKNKQFGNRWEYQK